MVVRHLDMVPCQQRLVDKHQAGGGFQRQGIIFPLMAAGLDDSRIIIFGRPVRILFHQVCQVPQCPDGGIGAEIICQDEIQVRLFTGQQLFCQPFVVIAFLDACDEPDLHMGMLRLK